MTLSPHDLDRVDRVTLGIGFAGVAAVGGLAGWGQAALGTALVVLLFAVVIHMRSPRGLIVVGLVLPLLPSIQGLPLAVRLAGRSLYLSDLLLPAGLLLALAYVHRERVRGLVRDVLPYAAVLGVGLAVAAVGAASLSFVLRDLRGPVYVLTAYAATVLLYRHRDAALGIRVVSGVLWGTALLILFQSLTGRQILAGRVEAVDRVEAALSGAGPDATRFLVAPKDLALLCCCAAIGMLLRGGSRQLWHRLGPAMVLPAALIVFFSFSRRALVAVAVTVAFVALVGPLLRVLLRSVVVAAVVTSIVVVSPLLPLPQESYVARQTAAFSTRVLEGLSAEARSQDLGIAFRELENEYAVQSVRGSPLIGHGLGATYRPNLPDQPFDGDDRDFGRTYAHNFYLWLAVKFGALGVIAFIWFVVTPIRSVVRGLRSRHDPRAQLVLAITAGVVGLCAVNWVAPVFNEPATAVVLGCALGVLRLHGSGLDNPGAVEEPAASSSSFRPGGA